MSAAIAPGGFKRCFKRMEKDSELIERLMKTKHFSRSQIGAYLVHETLDSLADRFGLPRKMLEVFE